MTWHRVVIELMATDADLGADALWAAGAAGIEEQPVTAEGQGVPGVRLLAGFADRANAEEARGELVRRGLGTAAVEPVTDDGLDGWRPWARPERAGPFVVTPPWCDELHIDGARTLWVDPGRTFGSGSHPTTRLVLAMIPDLVRAGDLVLDVGAGSGVLALGAALLGASQVVALDIDPAAPDVIAANAARNEVDARIRPTAQPLATLDVDAPFDLVLANLLAPILVELAPELRRVTRPGGSLVISGLLEDRWHEVLGALDGFAPASDALRTEDGWAAVALIRDGAR